MIVGVHGLPKLAVSQLDLYGRLRLTEFDGILDQMEKDLSVKVPICMNCFGYCVSALQSN